jgi:hypothetical protein
MNYRIAGADGKIYGPVGAEQIRQWIAQGRADTRTPVFPDGATDWTFLGLLPEFAAGCTATPPRIAAVTPSAGLRKTNGFATAGFVCGLLSWAPCCCCCLPFNLLGLVFSIIALIQISSQPEPQEGRAFAIIGLVLSGLSLLVAFGLGLVQLVLQPANTWHFD